MAINSIAPTMIKVSPLSKDDKNIKYVNPMFIANIAETTKSQHDGYMLNTDKVNNNVACSELTFADGQKITVSEKADDIASKINCLA